MSENLDIRARLIGSDELSPVLKKFLSNLREVESVTRRFNASMAGLGRVGQQSFDGVGRAAKAVSAQMQGLQNLSRSAARSYSADWGKASTQRLNDARRLYANLERLESSYQRQIERRAAAERRAGPSRSYGGGGRLPAPNIRTVAAGAAITGAGLVSAIRKRMEVQAAEVRAEMFGDLTKVEVQKLRGDFADKAGIKYGVGSTKVIDTAVEGLKAGVAKQYAESFADLALKAQAGLDVNPEAVGKLLGRLSSQMPWNTERFSKVLNAVAVANNSTAADGGEIIEAMRRSLSALATTKMTPEQLAALDATGISLGVQPFKMGTFASFLTSQIAGGDSARGQQASDLSSAANALGFGGRGAMAKAMRERPMEAIQQILDGLAKLPEKLRTKVAKQIGGREWMDELLTLVLGRDKLKDVVRDIESKPGFLDRTALQKIRSMQGRWASISAALGLVWEKVGAGLENWFDQISDSVIGLAETFDFNTIKQHVGALIDGAREGFGLRSWGEAVKSVADSFDAGTVAKWREFGKGFAEGIREFASGLKTAFSALGFLAGKNPADAREMGNLVAQLTGLTVALAALSPLLSVLTTLALGLTGIGNALALIGGSATAVALLSLFATRNQNTGIPDAHIKRPDETVGQWRERERQHRNQLYHKSSFGGATDFSGMRRSSDLSDNLNKFTGKIERAAFISNGPGGVQYAAIVGAGRGLGGSRGGRSFIGGVPNLVKSVPGQALLDFGAGRSGSIIRRDKIPSFSGGGGSVDGLSRSAFEKTFAGTPLAGMYDHVVSAAKVNGISPSLLAGVMAQETGRGKHVLGNNPGGVMIPGGGLMKFDNLGTGINRTAQAVAKNWNAAGGDLNRMGQRYAPVGAANDPNGLNKSWVPGVRKFMNDMGETSSGAVPGDVPAGLADRLALRGKANFMHGQYGGPGQNLTTITLASGKKVTVNAAASDAYLGFLNDLEASGYKIKSVSGYNLRKKVGGGGGWSQHAYGNAIDINPGSNPQFGGTDMPKDISDRAAKYGLSWGGDWSPRWRDPMHFEWNGTQPWKQKGVTDGVPSSMVQNVPSPIRGDASLGLLRNGAGGGGGPVSININGSSHDPEALATLVQRRIDESMNWRTHDTASEYT